MVVVFVVALVVVIVVVVVGVIQLAFFPKLLITDIEKRCKYFLWSIRPFHCQRMFESLPVSVVKYILQLMNSRANLVGVSSFLSLFTFDLGFVHPLQDIALHQCLPLLSVFCFPVPAGSLRCYVVLPSSIWSYP